MPTRRTSNCAAARFAELGRMVPGISQPVSKEEWMAAHPPGVRRVSRSVWTAGTLWTLAPEQARGPALGDKVFLHAGINPDRAPRELEDINKQVLAEIRRFDEYRRRMVDRRLILPFFTLSEISGGCAGRASSQRDACASRSEPAGMIDPLGSERRSCRSMTGRSFIRMGRCGSEVLRRGHPMWARSR